MRKPRIYYKKGYLVELIDGSIKLVNKITKVSYEVHMIEDQRQLIQLNNDYFVYSSTQTKYGTIPSHSIKEFYEVKYQQKPDGCHIFDATGKEILVLT